MLACSHSCHWPQWRAAPFDTLCCLAVYVPVLLCLPTLTPLSRLSADEALSAGLVSRVLPPEQLIPEAMKIADKLARWVSERCWLSWLLCSIHNKGVECYSPLHPLTG